MYKWIGLVGLLVAGVVFGVPGGGGSAPATSSSGGGDVPPFEPALDTTANIYIYVTLRQPEGPPASPIEIESTSCDLGYEFVQLKAEQPIWTRDPEECQYYLVYRTQWAPFTWGDLNLLSGYPDSTWIVDPIDDWLTFGDSGQYKWTTSTSARDYFFDTVWSDDGIWGSGYNTKGVCDENVNWYYVSVAVDTAPLPVKFSPEPSAPVGEVDQWLYPGDNIISYPVDINVRRADSFAMVIDTVDGVPAAVEIHKWDAVAQGWVRIAYIFLGHWNGSTPVAPGDVFRVVKTESDSSISNHTLTLASGTSAGDNYVMMPYQEYNMLLGVNNATEGINYVRAKDMLQDIPCAVEIHWWDAASQGWVRIAYYFLGNPNGNTRVLPGLPYRVVVNSTCTWPPE